MSKDVIANKEQLCQSFCQSVKKQKAKVKKIGGVNLTPRPFEASRVNWGYMHNCLDALYYGPRLTLWFHVFYNDVLSCIIHGIFTSDHFIVTNGVR